MNFFERLHPRLLDPRRVFTYANRALPTGAGGRQTEGAPRWRTLELLLRATDDEGNSVVEVLARLDLVWPRFSALPDPRTLDERVVRLRGERTFTGVALVLRALDASGRPYRDIHTCVAGWSRNASGFDLTPAASGMFEICRRLARGETAGWSVGTKTHADGRIALWLIERDWAVRREYRDYLKRGQLITHEYSYQDFPADASPEQVANAAAVLAQQAQAENDRLREPSARYVDVLAGEVLAAEQTGVCERLAREERTRELAATVRKTLTAHGVHM